MKNYMTISALSMMLFFTQGCGGENKKTETPADTKTSSEKQMTFEEQRIKLEEQRKADLAALIAEAKYYETSLGKLVYYKAEVDPVYDGGEKAMNTFLKENLKFPAVAEEEQLEGTVYVDFVVSENGVVTDVSASDHTYAKVDNEFKKEALRVVNLMPDWTPGLQNGKAVDVKFSVPITFKLQ